jgi:protein-tyrosine-phosphatase
MKILFVCKHNRFRSKVAEAYFNKINKNKNIKVETAGIFKGNPISKTVLDVGKKLGIRIKKGTRGLKEEYLNKYDLIIIVANDVPKSIMNGKRNVVVWKIPDTSQDNRKMIEIIMKKIFKKVDKLVESLEKKNGTRKRI